MLQKILDKPESYRRKISLLATGVFGVIIFVIWLVITQHDIKQAVRPKKEPIKTASQKFKESLPPLNTQEVITTELIKKGKQLEIK